MRKGGANRGRSRRTGGAPEGAGSADRAPTRENRLTWWAAGSILVVVQAVVLSMLFTPAPHPGGDNAAYLSLGHALESGFGYVELWTSGAPPHTKYPPAFPFVLAFLMALGASTWGAFKVLVAALVSLASILVFVWVGGRRGPVAGLVVALVTLLSAGWLEASRWVLSEPLFLCFLFLALWAADRAGAGVRRTGRGGWSPGWAWAAGAASLLALLTRSAALPLVLALLGAFLLARRWRAAALFGSVSALVGGGWALRSRAEAAGAYQSEFWMVNPYDPSLGTIGVGGLVGRIGNNFGQYTFSVIPGEWWGDAGALLPVLGAVLVGLAALGWGWRIVDRSVGTAELFLPLYAGLILVWPEVWSGDRFVLPLYPILLLHAGEGVVRLAGVASRVLAREGRGGGSGPRSARRLAPFLPAGLLAAGALALLLPAVPPALQKAETAAVCREVGAVDPFRCLGRAMVEFRDAAAWAGEHLPGAPVVLNRKPRIFFLLGGTTGWTYPFTSDPAEFLETADALGARYLLLDRVDGVSAAYLPPLLERAPGAFCWIRGWGEMTDLLGILPAGERGAAEIHACPPEYAPMDARGAEPRSPAPGRANRIPILETR